MAVKWTRRWIFYCFDCCMSDSHLNCKNEGSDRSYLDLLCLHSNIHFFYIYHHCTSFPCHDMALWCRFGPQPRACNAPKVLLFTVAEGDPKKRRRPPGGSGASGVAASALSGNGPPSSVTSEHSEALGPSTPVREMNSKLTAKVEVVVDSSSSRSEQYTLKLGDFADDVTEVGGDSRGIADDRCTLVDGVLAGV